jgi:hypothetical protein
MEQQRTLSIQHKFGENNDTARKVYVTEKAIKKIQVDPKLETADIDVNNNTWQRSEI